MTEHTITLTIPEGFRDHCGTVWAAVAESARADGYHWVADSIEEQVKPAVDEPAALWSVIAANVPGSHFLEPKQLVRTTVGWLDADGNGWGDFASFSDVEVLRVGIGDDQSDAYNMGRADFAEAIRRDISALIASTPLVVERRSYDKALALVAALLGES